MITVYTAPGCFKCTKTMDIMKKNNVSFASVDLTEDGNQEKLTEFKNKNLLELPIVTNEDGVLWNGGIQIHRVAELAAK